MKNIIPVVVVLLSLSSCSLAYRGLLGVDTTPQWQDSKDLQKVIKKRNLQDEFNLVLDTASYTNRIKNVLQDTVDNLASDTSIMGKRLKYKAQKVANDDLQPVQVRLFDHRGLESFKLVNCYVDPPIPMDWNVDNCFDSFPLFSNDLIQNTHTYDLQFLLSTTKTPDGKSIELSDLPKGDYYMIVMWNSFMIRPSKKLLKTVEEYIAANPYRNIKPIYINNHNAQLWMQLDAKQRKMINDFESEKGKS